MNELGYEVTNVRQLETQKRNFQSTWSASTIRQRTK